MSKISDNGIEEQQKNSIKHTQGEWTYKDNSFKHGDGRAGSIDVKSNNIIVAECSPYREKNKFLNYEGITKATANAKLIASAPLMLDTLKRISNGLGGGKLSAGDCQTIIMEVIKKAT